MDPEAARDVVCRRHHSASMRVAADHERPLAQLGRLELLHRGEERVQVEMRDDHAETGDDLHDDEHGVEQQY